MFYKRTLKAWPEASNDKTEALEIHHGTNNIYSQFLSNK